ncbi:MAG: peptide methionine sulfoxide reductase [Aurantibacter sp.]
MLLTKIRMLPMGYSEVFYQDKKYGVTRTDFNHGNSIKIFAQELGGNDLVSLNYYSTKKEEILKPCEMPEQKVIDFLNNYNLI